MVYFLINNFLRYYYRMKSFYFNKCWFQLLKCVIVIIENKIFNTSIKINMIRTKLNINEFRLENNCYGNINKMNFLRNTRSTHVSWDYMHIVKSEILEISKSNIYLLLLHYIKTRIISLR